MAEITSKLEVCTSKLNVKTGAIEKIKEMQQGKMEEGKKIKTEVTKLFLQIGSLVEKRPLNSEQNNKLVQKKKTLQAELGKIQDTIAKIAEAKAKLMEEANKLTDLEAKIRAENSKIITSTIKSRSSSEGSADINPLKVLPETAQLSSSALSTVLGSLREKIAMISSTNQSLSGKISGLESELKIKNNELAELSEDRSSADIRRHSTVCLSPAQTMSSSFTETTPEACSTSSKTTRLRRQSCCIKRPNGYEEKVQELAQDINVKSDVLQQKKQEFEGKVAELREEIKQAEKEKSAEAKKEETAMAEVAISEAKKNALKEELEKLKSNIQQSEAKINDILVFCYHKVHPALTTIVD